VKIVFIFRLLGESEYSNLKDFGRKMFLRVCVHLYLWIEAIQIVVNSADGR
jgi:hypothetical protein